MDETKIREAYQKVYGLVFTTHYMHGRKSRQQEIEELHTAIEEEMSHVNGLVQDNLKKHEEIESLGYRLDILQSSNERMLTVEFPAKDKQIETMNNLLTDISKLSNTFCGEYGKLVSDVIETWKQKHE